MITEAYILLFCFDSAKSAEIMRTRGGGTKNKDVKKIIKTHFAMTHFEMLSKPISLP